MSSHTCPYISLLNLLNPINLFLMCWSNSHFLVTVQVLLCFMAKCQNFFNLHHPQHHFCFNPYTTIGSIKRYSARGGSMYPQSQHSGWTWDRKMVNSRPACFLLLYLNLKPDVDTLWTHRLFSLPSMKTLPFIYSLAPFVLPAFNENTSIHLLFNRLHRNLMNLFPSLFLLHAQW